MVVRDNLRLVGQSGVQQLSGWECGCRSLEVEAVVCYFIMPNIINEVKLDFKDVLLRPKRSTLRSRADVSLYHDLTHVLCCIIAH